MSATLRSSEVRAGAIALGLLRFTLAGVCVALVGVLGHVVLKIVA